MAPLVIYKHFFSDLHQKNVCIVSTHNFCESEIWHRDWIDPLMALVKVLSSLHYLLEDSLGKKLFLRSL
jgi:hypothetical protein